MYNPNTQGGYWYLFYLDQENTSRFLTPERFWFARQVVDACKIEGDVLDVGCEIGVLLASIQGNRFGMDFSLSAIENNICRSFATLQMADILKGIPFDGRFDFITILQTLEHLDEPKIAIENCKAKLKENGKLIVSVPNCESGPDDYEFHIHSWNKKTLCDLLEECGLENKCMTIGSDILCEAWRKL